MQHVLRLMMVALALFALPQLVSVAAAQHTVTQIQLTEAIVHLVAAGLGVAVLARWAVAPAIQMKTVGAAKLGKNGYNRTWYAATRQHDITESYLLDLLQLLRRHMSGGPEQLAVPQLSLVKTAPASRSSKNRGR